MSGRRTEAQSDPVGEQAVANALASGGFVLRETVTVREIVVGGGVTQSHAATLARELGLSENGGKWAVTPAVKAALEGRALAEVLPGPRGLSKSAWPADPREVI